MSSSITGYISSSSKSPRSSTEEAQSLLPSPKESQTVVWKNINATVPSYGGKEGVRRIVLRDVNGVAYPNEVLAIMGGSGAGKTTLMNILAFLDTKGVEKKGSVLINGLELTKMEVRAMSAYVQQVDVFVGTLTVREQLTFSAILRMGRQFTREQKMDKVEEVIRQFNLTDAQDTIIGVPNKVKGISIGEKKRLAFACEVLTDPSILFCDEPTSGLDAFTASQVVGAMRLLADQGKTVISVIHQPSSSTFNMFHKVLFMANGHPVYHGPVSELCGFFTSVNLPVPESYNPADHAIAQLAISSEYKEKDLTRIEALTKYFEESPTGREMLKFVARQQKSHREIEPVKRTRRDYAAGFFTQLCVLLKRAFLTTLRDPVLLKVRAIQTIVTAVIIGIVNWQLKPVTGQNVQNIEGMLYNTCRDMNFLFLFPSINVVTSELPVLMREHKAHIYSTAAYFFSKSLAELPQYTVLPVTYSLIVYWMAGLSPGFWAFLLYTMLCIIMVWNAISVAYAAACVFGDEGSAVTYTPLVVLPMLILGGFYISFQAIPSYLRWISHLSWFRYSFEGLQINHWIRVEEIVGCMSQNETMTNPHCPGWEAGKSVLERRGMDGSLWLSFGVMILFTLSYRLLAYLALVLRTRFAK